jgi:DNA-binding MarR family transcriptional regulator
MLVQLTPRGLEVIDRAVEKHVENARQILSGLSDTLQRNWITVWQYCNALEPPDQYQAE